MTGPQAHWLPDGRRLHLHHGPIDLILDAQGPDRDRALQQAVARFETVLTGLVDELALLRLDYGGTLFRDPVAQRMARAVTPYHSVFVTPMAAVAGAVADEVLQAMLQQTTLDKAYVNNGGDIAFHLAQGQHFDSLSVAGPINIPATSPTRALATSGWQGRSYSLGIAEAVTVAAPCAAMADVAATLIANTVELPGHPAITRAPANTLSPDSDLGERQVTTGVGPLRPSEITDALAKGQDYAQLLRHRGLIHAATLYLQGQVATVSGDANPAFAADTLPLHSKTGPLAHA